MEKNRDMVLETVKLKDVCKNLLGSIEFASIESESNLLELSSSDDKLIINFTNGEYFISTSTDYLSTEDNIFAVIKSETFLQLISKITTELVEISTIDNYLLIKSGGEYKIPIIFEGEKPVELKRIDIDNVINSFKINTDILQSIVKYNSIELKKKGSITSPLHQLFYIDDKGCITYNSGACVNNFNLENPIRLVIPEKVVKLFRLLSGNDVSVSIGFDQISTGITQTKIKLQDINGTSISAILSIGDDRLNQFPAEIIRKKVNDNYPYTAVVDRQEIITSIDRLRIFNEDNLYMSVSIDKEYLTLFDYNKFNFEKIKLLNNIDGLDEYEFKIKSIDLEIVLKSCIDKYLTIKFGNRQSIVIDRKNIKNILPEVVGGN